MAKKQFESHRADPNSFHLRVQKEKLFTQDHRARVLVEPGLVRKAVNLVIQTSRLLSVAVSLYWWPGRWGLLNCACILPQVCCHPLHLTWSVPKIDQTWLLWSPDCYPKSFWTATTLKPRAPLPRSIWSSIRDCQEITEYLGAQNCIHTLPTVRLLKRCDSLGKTKGHNKPQSKKQKTLWPHSKQLTKYHEALSKYWQ